MAAVTTLVRSLRLPRPIAAVVLVAVVVLLAAPAAASPPRRYYLSLGDSLAVGMQPDAAGHDRPTGQGYVDVIGRRLAASIPELTLVKVGCPGETSTTMLAGGRCRYSAGSQLAQAERFLAAHRGAVSLVTVDIGDNDVERCFASGKVDSACASAGLAAVRTNLPVIVGRLRAAAGTHVPVVGLADYDQFLAEWLRGPAGRRAARRSVAIVTRLNGVLDDIYKGAGAIAADATGAFATADLKHFTQLAGHGSVPRAVAQICNLTWVCSGAPIGLDDHANARGYAVLARVIERALLHARPRLLAHGHA